MKDGINLLPYLRDPELPYPERELYWSYRNKAALRIGNWKLVSSTSQWNGERAPWSLYHLAEDPSETEDLAPRFPDRIRKFADRWESFLEP